MVLACAVALLATILSAPLPQSVLAAPASATETLSTAQIPRAVVLPLPLKDGDTVLGEVPTRVTGDRVVVLKSALLGLLKASLTAAALQRIETTPDAAGFASLEDLAARGAAIAFDPALLELNLVVNLDERTAQDLSLGLRPTLVASENLRFAAPVSGFVNLFAGADYLWQGLTEASGFGGFRFDAEAALRVGPVVLEAEGAVLTDATPALCPPGARCFFDSSAGFKRRATRMVYDRPAEALRFELGDARTPIDGFQSGPNVLGISVQHAPQVLRPHENTRPTGRGSFRLERAARVDVVVNGAVVQSLRLKPGVYNVADLPLSSGYNQAELRIEDDTGNRQVVPFSNYSDNSLLGVGKSEWAATGGIASYLNSDEVHYLRDNGFASAFHRYGLSNTVTVASNAQADKVGTMAGLGASTATRFGVVSGQVAGSVTRSGVGGAASADWGLNDFRGTVSDHENVRLGVEFKSSLFHSPGESVAQRDPILYPSLRPWLRLSGNYGIALTEKINLSLSGRYAFVDNAEDRFAINGVRGDRYGVDVSLSQTLTNEVNVSVTAGYSNETYSRSNFALDAEEGAVFAVARLNWRMGDGGHVSASVDTLNQRSQVTGYQQAGHGIEHWDVSVDATHDTNQNAVPLSGTVNHTGNRAEVQVRHGADFTGVTSRLNSVESANQRTSARAGVAIAFAGDHVAIGAPIRGSGGFAIVAPHETLMGKDVLVGTTEQPVAKADVLGPALVSNLSAYSPVVLPFDVADLPVGYSVGTSTFDLNPPYRAGYALDVGSGYSVSVFGQMVDGQGAPLKLQAGMARSISYPGKTLPVFTNSAGRFAVEGLAEGRWELEMASDSGSLIYTVLVPKGATGLVKAATLSPMPPGGGLAK
jgi:outer membrane usher protein